MRILKLSLILRIEEELTDIFKVEDKGQFSKKRNSKYHPLNRESMIKKKNFQIRLKTWLKNGTLSYNIIFPSMHKISGLNQFKELYS